MRTDTTTNTRERASSEPADGTTAPAETPKKQRLRLVYYAGLFSGSLFTIAVAYLATLFHRMTGLGPPVWEASVEHVAGGAAIWSLVAVAVIYFSIDYFCLMEESP